MSVSVAAADDLAIRQLFARHAAAWNSHDMEAMAADLAVEAEWVNVVGMHWKGRDLIHRAHAALHRTMFAQSTVQTEAIEMREIAPGIVLAISTGSIMGAGRTPDGSEYPPSRNRMSVLLVKGDGEWRILHAHNTTIDARAAAHDPANGKAQ